MKGKQTSVIEIFHYSNTSGFFGGGGLTNAYGTSPKPTAWSGQSYKAIYNRKLWLYGCFKSNFQVSTTVELQITIVEAL